LDAWLGYGAVGEAAGSDADRPPDAQPTAATVPATVATTGVLGRVAAATRRMGTLVILRNPTSGSGPVQSPYPPTLDGPVLAQAYPGAATLIAINADEALGQIIAGDEITIAGVPYVVIDGGSSRPFSAATPGFDGIRISPPLAAPAAAGTPLSFVWESDIYVYARITSFPGTLVDGSLVLMEDLQVTIPAQGISRPANNAKLIIGSDIRSVVTSLPIYANGQIVRWQLQAR
jgi:hypothetical protein